jgi:transcriptional regulator with XRE-family HTH domain
MATTAFAAWLEEQFARSVGVRAKDIAAAVKISPGYLSALRSGKNNRPSAARAKAIAEAFAARRGLTTEDTHALVAEVLRVVRADDAEGPGGGGESVSEGSRTTVVRALSPSPGWLTLIAANLRQGAPR